MSLIFQQLSVGLFKQPTTVNVAERASIGIPSGQPIYPYSLGSIPLPCLEYMGRTTTATQDAPETCHPFAGYTDRKP